MAPPLWLGPELAVEMGMLTVSTVHIIDPDCSIAERVRTLLAPQDILVLHYCSIENFRQGNPGDRPACVVMELALADEDPARFITEMRQQPCPLPILILTAQATVRRAVDAMVAGAAFVLEKPGDNAVLKRLIQGALHRDAESVRHCAEARQISSRLKTLSPREREVSELIFQGLETKVIASRLGISPKTVEYHRAQIFAKMDVSNAVQLTVAMLRVERAGK
jgi:FixJ family two-component response regulator